CPRWSWPDESDSMVADAREPHVAVGPGGDAEGSSHAVVGGVVRGDRTVDGDATETVVGVREPHGTIRTHRDSAGLLDMPLLVGEGRDGALCGDASDQVAAGAGEPQIPVRTGHHPRGEHDVGPGAVEHRQLTCGGDAPDTTVHG